LDHQNNYIECLNIDNKTAKSFNIPRNLNVVHNYFDSSNKIIFRFVFR